MRRSAAFLISVSFALSMPVAAADLAGAVTGKPPATRTDTVADTYGSVTVADPYRWLEDQNAPETRAWIDAQNRYSEGILHALPGRDALRKRLGELLHVETISAPTEANGRYFFSKRLPDQDLAVLYVRKGATGAAGQDEVLIDPHPLSADHRTSVYFVDVHSGGSLVGYGVRVGGEDEATIHFRDVDTGKDLADVLPRARYYNVAIGRDKKLVYYSRQTSEGPRVYAHRMGSDSAADEKIFGDGYGPEKIIGATLSDDFRWLQIVVLHGSAAVKSEVYVQNVAEGGKIVPIVNDVDARFNPEVGGDRLFLQTNWKAPNGRILAVDLKDPSRAKWKEIVPTRDVPIDGYTAVGGRLFVRYLENVQSKIRVFDGSGKASGELSIPEIGSMSGLRGRWDSKEGFFSFVSYVTPPTIYRYDIAKGARTVWAKQRVPVNSADFTVRQVRYASKDGTSVPMFVVHRKGMKLDGSHPALLTGYGGFNSSSTPGFSALATAWVEGGGVYAVANLRGGGEFGEDWHHAGMLGKKQNVFDDFIAAGEYLIRERYTSSSHLAIVGGSNGGLLVGAAMTQRPDLFAAVVCSYPLLDMVRYHKFLVAGFWVPEYGSADNPEQFPFLYAYSPYHRVKPGTKYPAVLFITGDSDTRVAPLHARKMTAVVQASTGSDRPVILHYDTKSGHSGGSTPVPKQIDDLTDELAFLFAETR